MPQGGIDHTARARQRTASGYMSATVQADSRDAAMDASRFFLRYVPAVPAVTK